VQRTGQAASAFLRENSVSNLETPPAGCEVHLLPRRAGTDCGTLDGRLDRVPYGRDTAALSTSPSPANLSPVWKQEVNRRVAAHLSRKAPSAGEHAATPESKLNPVSRAAQAAARVAARYANAPSYSEMLAVEARAAVAAAEAASRAALQAQAAAESVLASIEAASEVEATAEQSPRTALHVVSAESAGQQQIELHAPSPGASDDFFTQPEFELIPETAHMDETVWTEPSQPAASQGFAIRWEPDMPALRREPEIGRVSHTPESFDFGAADWRGPDADGSHAGEIGVVEPAQPIYANLIEFPRELVAARKVRPRLVEGPLSAAQQDVQLSIFEVDPVDVSTEPEVVQDTVNAGVSSWTEPEWSGMQLGAEPEEELYHQLEPEPDPQTRRDTRIELAPLSRRALAVFFDVALIGAAFVTAAMVAETRVAELPGLRAIETGSAIALLLVAALYVALFFTLARATPGMRYAQIRLCTFDGQVPARAQRTTRLVAMLLSVAPLGLGIVWAIFDDDRLAWHDRLSRTYLRKC
jgi:uncharacterized RDD family membrane protein YckC